jgi:hypothetical protein
MTWFISAVLQTYESLMLGDFSFAFHYHIYPFPIIIFSFEKGHVLREEKQPAFQSPGRNNIARNLEQANNNNTIVAV